MPLATGLSTLLQSSRDENDILNDPDSEVFIGTLLSEDAELPLYQAVSYRSIDAVKRLLRQKKLSIYSLYDEITERLLAEKDINVNSVRGRGRLETPSTSLHYTATRLDNVLLRRLLVVPGIDLNLCIAGRSQSRLLHRTDGLTWLIVY
ncbi:unnamed protein product [Penicillium camemberti]|uniref:Str. FM013 n=1 Tax=Penicillium camemberti (strain FM 013) TaxID=1429867 RepID=A0A0G4PGU9_PENC3|nr:unnamed protein product [Penicillium camemberti]